MPQSAFVGSVVRMRPGSTLLEVVVAMSIFAIAVTAVITSAMTAMLRSDVNRDVKTSILDTQSVVEAMAGLQFDLLCDQNYAGGSPLFPQGQQNIKKLLGFDPAKLQEAHLKNQKIFIFYFDGSANQDAIRYVSEATMDSYLASVPAPNNTMSNFSNTSAVYDPNPATAQAKKGCAVISDAVNLLSNAWNNSKSSSNASSSWGTFNATATIYNTAILSGIVPTPTLNGGSYSGGFENFPRFHENWSNKCAHIRGSFVNLFNSQVAKSPWVYGSPKYEAPFRDWNFDTGFLDINNLPPATPLVVGAKKVVWWKFLGTRKEVVAP